MQSSPAESQAAEEGPAAAAAPSTIDDASGGAAASTPVNVPRAPLSRSGSISSSNGADGGVSAASHGWMIDWQHRWQLEHRYGVSTEASPIAPLPPVPIEAPEPPSPSVTPPIEKREAIDDSTGDDGQPPGDGGSGDGSGGIDGSRHHSGNTEGGGSVVGSLQGSPNPAVAAAAGGPPLGMLAKPAFIRSETKGTMGPPADGSAAAPSQRPGESDLISEGPSLADQPLPAAPAVARRLPVPVPPRPSQPPQQPPSTAPTAPTSQPGPVGGGGSDGGSAFFPVQRSNSGGRRPVPQWAAAAATAAQQQQHGRGPSLSSTLTASTGSSSSASSSSAGGPGALNPRFKMGRSLSGGSARAFVPSGNALEDELAVAPGKEDAVLPKQRRDRTGADAASGGQAPYPGGFPSLQVARRLAEDNFDSLDSRELLAIDWEHRYGVESLAGPLSASPSPTTLYQHQDNYLHQFEQQQQQQQQQQLQLQQQQQQVEPPQQEEGEAAAASVAAVGDGVAAVSEGEGDSSNNDIVVATVPPAAAARAQAAEDAAPGATGPATGVATVYLHAFPPSSQPEPPPQLHQPPTSPPLSGAQHIAAVCTHCEEQPAAMSCPQCAASYCVECDTVLHRAVKLRGHQRRRVAQASLALDDEEAHPPTNHHSGPIAPPTATGAAAGADAAVEVGGAGGPLSSAAPPTGSGEGGSGGVRGGVGSGGMRHGSGGGSSSRRHSGNLLMKEQHLEIDRDEIRILAKLGEGYFGVVFRGLWAGQSVAVKKLKHGTRRQVEEFRNEVRVLAKLRHPNITTFYGVTASPDWLIVTELLHGSLYRLLHSQSASLPLRLQMRIAKDIACGAAYIHGLSPSIVHRDINSSNVLLTGDVHMLTRIVEEGRNEPVAKLSDFGLSRSVERFMTQCTGNAYYLAPEVFRGQHYTERADCYSYGILLWELFTRKYPFGHLNPRSAAFQQAEGLRPPIEGQDVPPAVVAVMSKAWEPHPENRLPFRDIVRAWEAIEHADERGFDLQAPTTIDALLLLPESLPLPPTPANTRPLAPAHQQPPAQPQQHPPTAVTATMPLNNSGGSHNGYLMTPLEFRQQQLDERLQRRPGLAALVGRGLVQPLPPAPSVAAAASGKEGGDGTGDGGGEGRRLPSPLPQTFFGYDISSRYFDQGEGGRVALGLGSGGVSPPLPPQQQQGAAALFPSVGYPPSSYVLAPPAVAVSSLSSGMNGGGQQQQPQQQAQAQAPGKEGEGQGQEQEQRGDELVVGHEASVA